MEMEKMKRFAAIDFETANWQPTSVCSVGIVVMNEREIEDQYYSLIRPEPNYYFRKNTEIHGLSRKDTDDAPAFFEMPYPDYRFYCTCRLARKYFKGLENYQLHTVAAHCGFVLENHHHALADAEACGVIMRKLLDCVEI